jgi:hypothetical protein
MCVVILCHMSSVGGSHVSQSAGSAISGDKKQKVTL